MSAFPLIAKKQLSAQKVKMAMALKGKNNHYKWCEGRREYFITTAQHCGYASKMAEQLLDDILSKVDKVIDEVKSILPNEFPEHIAISIFEGMKLMQKRLEYPQ